MTQIGPGWVSLVGAGPGDPGLLTVRGRRALERADVVLYDHLASPSLMASFPAGAFGPNQMVVEPSAFVCISGLRSLFFDG